MYTHPTPQLELVSNARIASVKARKSQVINWQLDLILHRFGCATFSSENTESETESCRLNKSNYGLTAGENETIFSKDLIRFPRTANK